MRDNRIEPVDKQPALLWPHVENQTISWSGVASEGVVVGLDFYWDISEIVYQEKIFWEFIKSLKAGSEKVWRKLLQPAQKQRDEAGLEIFRQGCKYGEEFWWWVMYFIDFLQKLTCFSTRNVNRNSSNFESPADRQRETAEWKNTSRDEGSSPKVVY